MISVVLTMYDIIYLLYLYLFIHLSGYHTSCARVLPPIDIIVIIIPEPSYISLAIIPAVLVCCLLLVTFIIVWNRPHAGRCRNSHLVVRRKKQFGSTPPYADPPQSPYMPLQNNTREESSFSYERISSQDSQRPSVQQASHSFNGTSTSQDTLQERLDRDVPIINWRIGGSTTVDHTLANSYA